MSRGVHGAGGRGPAGRAEVAARGEGAELRRMLLRTVLPTGVVLAAVLAVYGGTGHDLTIILQDRFPDDSEWSGVLTVVAGSALMVCAGVALGALVVARTLRGTRGGAPPVERAGLALATLLIVLGFDDMMMVHDAVLPGAGVPEDVGLALYAVLGVGLAAWALPPLRGAGLSLCFVAALALLAGSLGGDVLESLVEDSAPGPAGVLGHAEDVVKLLAYSALGRVGVLVGRRVLDGAVAGATQRPGSTQRSPGGVGGADDSSVTIPLRF